MLSRNHKRLVGWLAFAATLVVVLLAPRLARAAILPACEDHELTLMPLEWLARAPIPTEACTLGAALAADDDAGDVRVPAMCDDRAASVVAPQRILPIADARIDAAPGWDAPGEIGPAWDAGPKDAPVGPPAFALADCAVLGGGLVVPPAPSEVGPAFLPIPSGERAGVRRAIDHPPR